MATTDLNSLLRRVTLDDDEEVLSAADSALNKSPKDLNALHAKVVALLKLDRFDDALRTLEIGGEQLQERARLEHAYALYKAGKLEDATRIVSQGSQTRGLRHVEAQISYRAEQFESAVALYRDLSGEASGVAGEENDLKINSRAVDAQLEWAGKGELARRKKPGREDLEAFETAYNAACGCIARGELGQSEVLLKRAKGIITNRCLGHGLNGINETSDLCNALEDMSEDDKKAETLPITVQQIYVLSRQGKTDEAEQMRKGLDVSE